MDSAKQEHYVEDTRLGLTFTSKQEEFLIERSRIELTPKSTAEESVTHTETKVSDLPFTSPKSVSSHPKIIEVSSRSEANIVRNLLGRKLDPRPSLLKGVLISVT